jgi:geranylgeranyl reductase family protein
VLSTDVLIVGAGPAGTAMAARLAQHGLAHRVLVLDRYEFPRDKPCGGGLTGHAEQVMAELELELDVPHRPAPLARVRFGEFDRVVRLAKPVQVIRRSEFDHSLVAQARGKGVEIIEGEGVKDLQVVSDGVQVRTTKGRDIRATILVGADGAPSVVRKKLVASKAVPHRLFRAEIQAPASGVADDTMVYDFSLMSRGLRGYLWVFPVSEGRVNVGLMHYPSTRLGGRELTELLREGLSDHGIELPEKSARGWPVWGYHPKTPVSAPRILTVGDAAGIDGLTGEGIAVAMEQAVVAGDTVARALSSRDFSFSSYRRDLRRAVVGRELNLDRHLSRLLYRSASWRSWLSLVLFDPEVLELYAARVDGTQILADQRARLFWSLIRHLGRRRKRLQQLENASPATLPGPQ